MGFYNLDFILCDIATHVKSTKNFVIHRIFVQYRPMIQNETVNMFRCVLGDFSFASGIPCDEPRLLHLV